jgi:hypothetical protein
LLLSIATRLSLCSLRLFCRFQMPAGDRTGGLVYEG